MVLPTPAGTFTSNSGTPGIGDNLTPTAYDLAIKASLNSRPLIRNIGVTVRPERVPHPGESVTMNKFNYLTEAQVTAAKTPLTEESDVNAVKLPPTTPVVITPQEYGLVVTHTKFLANRTLAPFDAFKALAIADNAAKVLDELVQDTLKAGVTEVVVDGGTEAALTNADVATADSVRDTVVYFQENDVPTWDGEFYLAVMHPRVLADLRAEAGSGGWRIAKEYGNDSVLKRLATEVGEFEGVRFVQNNRVRKGTGTGVSSYNGYFLGRGGLAESVITEPELVVGPMVDNLRRFVTLGWKADIGWAVYEPKAVRILLTSSSAG